MAKTLYVTDMDGTLLGADSRVSAYSAKLISRLSTEGALITVATARTPATVQILLADTYMRLPAIVITGAALWDRERLKYINPILTLPETSAKIFNLCHKYGINPFRYTLNDSGEMLVYHNGTMSRQDKGFIDDRLNLGLKNFVLDNETGLEAELQRTILHFAMGERERVFALANELRTTANCSVSCYTDNFEGVETALIEVFAPNVSKAAAVKRLATEVGAERIVVFGDNLNDTPMMRIADVAVAVGNAHPEVKAIAHHIIGANTTDAVAHFIEQDYCG